MEYFDCAHLLRVTVVSMPVLKSTDFEFFSHKRYHWYFHTHTHTLLYSVYNAYRYVSIYDAPHIYTHTYPYILNLFKSKVNHYLSS